MTGIPFKPGNQQARKPRLSEPALAAFRQRMETLLLRLGWDERDLDEALGYPDSAGRWTRQIRRVRHPSQRYRERFESLWQQAEAGEVPPKPDWAPALVYDPELAAVPLQRVVATARQCAECAAQAVEGRWSKSATWWWFGHPQSRICPGHQRERRRRRNWFRRCLALGCPHAAAVDGLKPPVYTCSQETCDRRRWSWRQSWEQNQIRQYPETKSGVSVRGETMNGTYKFRAECQQDIDHLLALIPDENVLSVTVRKVPGIEWAPDRECEIELNGIELAQLRQLTGRVPDGYVMVETVATLDEYSGERI